MAENSFLFIGGDRRMAFAAAQLAREGYPVVAWGLGQCSDLPGDVQELGDPARMAAFPNWVFPLPLLGGGGAVNAPFAPQPVRLEDLLPHAPAGCRLLGGQVPPDAAALAARYGLQWQDYYGCEELAVQGAVATAEGAIALALGQLPVTLCGCRCLITGFGRIGRALGRLLVGLGARVTVAARRPSDREWALSMGCGAIPLELLGEALPRQRLIVNTPPSLLFTPELLQRISPRALLIDLASRPGGVDFAAAQKLGLQVQWALGLPGKTAPESAGEAIARTLLQLAPAQR